MGVVAEEEHGFTSDLLRKKLQGAENGVHLNRSDVIKSGQARVQGLTIPNRLFRV